MTTTDSTPSSSRRRATSSTSSWLLPALTFLAGCLLGAVIVGAGTFGGGDDGQDGAAPPPTQGPAEDATDAEAAEGELVVRVPESCLRAADGASQATGQVDDVVAAVRDLDARRLQEIVDQIQQVQPEVQRLAEQCRSVAGERLEDVVVTPAPAVTPTS